MSDETGIKKGDDAVSKFLTSLLSKAKNAQAGFARIYPIYQRLQTERYMTENASEGSQWKPLKSEKYIKEKKRMYGGGERRKSKKRPAGTWNSYPGNGSKLLIATSTLAGAVIGPGAPFEGTDKHLFVSMPTSMQISVITGGDNADGKKFEYAGYVAKERPFMVFGKQSLGLMKKELSQFLLGF